MSAAVTKRGERCESESLCDVYCRVIGAPLLYSLLSSLNFRVDHSDLGISLSLNEQPCFSTHALSLYLAKHPEHQQVWQTYRLRFQATTTTNHYRPTATAPEGRYYAILSAAQTLLFGSSHVEIDMTGAHCEIIRRFARTANLLSV